MMYVQIIILLLAQGLSTQMATDVYVWSGTKVIMQCAVTADHPIQISWHTSDYRMIFTKSKTYGQRTFSPFTNRVRAVSEDMKNATVEIFNVTASDEGHYTCVTNSYPLGSTNAATVHLHVYVAPTVRLHLKAVNASEYQQVIAECLAIAATPAAAILWITSGNASPSFAVIRNTTIQNGTEITSSKLAAVFNGNLNEQRVSCLVYQPNIPFKMQRNITMNAILFLKNKGLTINVTGFMCLFGTIMCLVKERSALQP